MKTKVYVTIGPSFHTTEDIIKAIDLGIAGVRINLSHGSLEKNKEWLHEVIEACNYKKIDILMDMQGPELRIGKINKQFDTNEIYSIDTIPFTKEVVNEWQIDEICLLDDGKIKLVRMNENEFKVLVGGLLSSNKSVTLSHSIHLPICTNEDLENIRNANKYHITSIMQPFVRSKKDIVDLKEVLKENNVDLKVFAKLEDREGVLRLEEILEVSDVIVIARGDLGNSIPLYELPKIQKEISDLCNKHHKDFMVVTQMLNSMINSPFPTRAEVSDIFHAVNDGAAYVMLTGETAGGKYPLEAIEMICKTVETSEMYTTI